jgi:hypothetical protein
MYISRLQESGISSTPVIPEKQALQNKPLVIETRFAVA